jgi:hypothetical protein
MYYSRTFFALSTTGMQFLELSFDNSFKGNCKKKYLIHDAALSCLNFWQKCHSSKIEASGLPRMV